MLLLLSRFSQIHFFVTLWTVVLQTPLSMGFSRQEYWSGLPFPTLGDLPNPGIQPMSPALASYKKIKWSNLIEIIETLDNVIRKRLFLRS